MLISISSCSNSYQAEVVVVVKVNELAIKTIVVAVIVSEIVVKAKVVVIKVAVVVVKVAVKAEVVVVKVDVKVQVVVVKVAVKVEVVVVKVSYAVKVEVDNHPTSNTCGVTEEWCMSSGGRTRKAWLQHFFNSMTMFMKPEMDPLTPLLRAL